MPNLKDHNLRPLAGTMNEGMVPLMTSVEISSAAAVTTDNNPTVGTWSKPGATTGVYRWVMKDAIAGPADKVFAVPAFRAAVAVDLKPQIKAKSITAGILTIDIVLNAVATPTDPSAACGLEMLVWVKTSAVKP